MSLGFGLVLQYVFHVEELQSDLIYVGQLLDENWCVGQIDDNFIVLQDCTTMTVIDVGKRGGETFYFRGVESSQR